ncbi:MAG: HD domain-containing phosphohydrolase [Dehalococcoidia bacterium]
MHNKKIAKTTNRSEDVLTPKRPQLVPLMDSQTQGRHIAEKITGQSDARDIAAIFNWVSEYVTFQDIENRILWANDNVVNATGLPLDKLKERQCYEIWHKRQQACPHCPFQEIFRNGKSVEREIVTTSRGICLVRGGPIRDDQGNIIAMAKVVSDVTERKKDEELLKQSEERYSALFGNSFDMVYIHDFEGNVIDANQAALDALGYTREELPTLNFRSFLSAEQMLRAMHLVERIRKTGTQHELTEFTLRCKDGTYKTIEARAAAIYRGKKPYAVQAIACDTSARKKSEKNLASSVETLKKTLKDAVSTMAKIVEMRDPYTAGHQQRVADLATTIATEMKLSIDRIELLDMAASVHDIGKTNIPAEILSRPGKLSDLEFQILKTHSQSGYDILKNIEFPWQVAQIVLQHHERMNGSGYPNRLKGEDILLEAKIIAVADVVEAMASHRPYRPALGIDLALEEIINNKGILFDPNVADACVKLFLEKRFKFV